MPHRLPHSLFLLFGGVALLALPSRAEPEARPEEMPRIPATEPRDALTAFEIRPGFRLELAAHEPLVVDPIDIDFDERGRMFVVEMRGYSEHREDALGRIRLLTDEDGDGFFETATIYADNLKWPTSVCCYEGGVFVSASPEILYFKDLDGDGVSDEQETVFTGFGTGLDRLNMQALVNSLTWGPDNRIWGATARNGGQVRRPDQTESEALRLRGADFSFDPKTRELRAENGTAQFGMSFDTWGRRFVCSNSNHIQWVAWERDWVKENPYFSLPAPLVSIADDGGAAPVFRISPDEPWRIVRTRWRVAGVVRGMVEGGGRVSGYFTSAAGITIYTGRAFGEEYFHNAFVGDVGSNLVHRKILDRPEGTVQPIATRAADEKETEFLRSRDNWFRPVNFANGPDGCLYICDMYRETIEHPWSIPEGIKKHVDLNSGNDRGRIWRVVPESFERSPFSLDGDHGWALRTRARLAYEKGEKHNRPILSPAQAILEDSDSDDPWALAMQLNRLNTPEDMVSAWTQTKSGSASETWQSSLAEMIGKTGNLPAIAEVIETIAETGIGSRSEGLLSSLGHGLETRKIDFTKADPEGMLDPIFAAARKTAASMQSAPEARSNALGLLQWDAGSEAGEIVRSIILESNASDSLRQQAIRIAIDRPGELAPDLIDSWKSFSPVLRSTSLEALTTRTERARALLLAINSGKIAPTEIPAGTAEGLRHHRDPEVKSLASDLLPAPEIVDREKIVERYQASLKLQGDSERGKAAFIKGACITCHRTTDGEGKAVGPDVATFQNAGADSLLKNLFDPNAEVAPQYQAYTFELNSGETLMGIIAREDATHVTVRMPGGLEKSFPRKEVEGMKGLGRSLMPEGIEAALSEQDVADLLAYLTAAE